MTPGAPTEGARSRFPGHRGSTEAGTILKDSGKRRCSSKGLACGSPLIDEAGAASAQIVSFALPLCMVKGTPLFHSGVAAVMSAPRRGARRHLPAGLSPTGERHSMPAGDHAPSGYSRIGHSSALSAPASSMEAAGSTVITASSLRAR